MKMVSNQAGKKVKMEVLDILSGEDIPATRFMISLKYFRFSTAVSFHRDDVIVSQGQECLANRRGSFVLRLTVGGIWK